MLAQSTLDHADHLNNIPAITIKIIWAGAGHRLFRCLENQENVRRLRPLGSTVFEEGCCRPWYIEGGMVCHFLVSESAAIRTLMAAAEQAYDLIDSRSLLQVERPVSESSVVFPWSSTRTAPQPNCSATQTFGLPRPRGGAKASVPQSRCREAEIGVTTGCQETCERHILV